MNGTQEKLMPTDMITIEKIRRDFPILNSTVHGKPLVYLDNAATSQKPLSVIQRIQEYYQQENANIHRGVHYLAEIATLAYETARRKIADFIQAGDAKEIIFTTGTTGAINLVAYSWGRAHISAGDVIILSEMEHHSNLVPWQIIAQEKNARLKFIRITENGELDLEHFYSLLHSNVKLVSITHMSNVLGTINPVQEIIDHAHAVGAKVLLDGAQSAPHIPVNVRELDCDFYAFSSHKMLGPTGMGALYGKAELLEDMPPFLGGGEMIEDVYADHSTYANLPHKFEAGTPHIAGAIGFGAAIDYLNNIGMTRVHEMERDITTYALSAMKELSPVTIYGNAAQRGGVITFNVNGIHPLDLAQYLDTYGFALRSGHHCAQPLLRKLGVSSTIRASFYIYNLKSEVDRLIERLQNALTFFKVK